MKIIRKSRTLLKRSLTALQTGVDFQSARRNLLSSSDLSEKENALLRKVLLRVYRKDGMYVPFEAQGYLSAGLSAIRCIENALKESTCENPIRSILDLPCGYGRVLRFLKARFPESEIIISELDTTALDFCERVFSVRGVKSGKDFGSLALPNKFDLIWCGSLTTHLDERATTELLKFFHDHLMPGGVCVFTTHGQLVANRIEKKTGTYLLSDRAQHQILSQFHRNGYGYADYDNQRGYGISIVSRERILALARSVGPWKETSYWEQGWDNCQDVYGFTRPDADSVNIADGRG